MSYRNYEFVLAGNRIDNQNTSDIDLYKVRAYSIQEALSEVFIRLHTLRSKDGKDWKIVKVIDATHFGGVKAL